MHKIDFRRIFTCSGSKKAKKIDWLGLSSFLGWCKWTGLQIQKWLKKDWDDHYMFIRSKQGQDFIHYSLFIITVTEFFNIFSLKNTYFEHLILCQMIIISEKSQVRNTGSIQIYWVQKFLKSRNQPESYFC